MNTVWTDHRSYDLKIYVEGVNNAIINRLLAFFEGAEEMVVAPDDHSTSIDCHTDIYGRLCNCPIYLYRILGD